VLNTLHDELKLVKWTGTSDRAAANSKESQRRLQSDAERDSCDSARGSDVDVDVLSEVRWRQLPFFNICCR